MLIIASKDISPAAKEELKRNGELCLFEGISPVYQSIRNHPDIYLTPINNHIVVAAPNTPDYVIHTLKSHHIDIIPGQFDAGRKYPESARYNSVITDKICVHKCEVTDPALKKFTQNLQFINVKQAYTRCNLLPLPNGTYITSDNGIYKTMSRLNFKIFLTNPTTIILKGQKHGFFGGCCGIIKDILFINGALGFLPDSACLTNLILNANLRIQELTTSMPEDIGSIFGFYR